MSSIIDICNIALAYMGQSRRISSLDDTSVEAAQCKLHYEPVKKAILARYPWRFAERCAALTLRNEDTHPEWPYVHEYPSGCIRILKIMPTEKTWSPELVQEEPFDIGMTASGKSIFCNLSAGWIKYIDDISDPTLFPPLFVQALGWSLAIALITSTVGGGNIGVKNNLMQYFQESMNAAMAADANECQEQRTQPISDYERARL